MALHNQTEFYLESMQPDWLWNKHLRRFYEFTVGRPLVYIMLGLIQAVYSALLAVLVAILVRSTSVEISRGLLGALLGVFPAGVLISLTSSIALGWRKGLYIATAALPIGGGVGFLISSLTPGLDRSMMGLVVGLVTGGIIGVLASIIGKEAYGSIIAKESYAGIAAKPLIGWSWEELRRTSNRENTVLWAGAVIDVLGSLLVTATVTVERGLFSGLLMGGVTILAGLLLFCLLGGVQIKTLSKQVLVLPNQGIRLSARIGTVFFLAFGSGAFVGTWVIISTVAGPTLGWICGLVAGISCGIVVGWFMGWDACVRHVVLRMLFRRADSLPRNYTHFLDYAAERILLRKIGGGYVFVHRLLLEYFALLAMQEVETEPARRAKLDATDARVYHNRGLIYAEFSEYQQAIENLTRAIELDPKEITAYSDRGLMYIRCEEYQKAVGDFTRAIELDPAVAWLYVQRGRSYHELKEYEEAIADFTRAAELESKRASIYGERARSYHLNKEYEKAIADFTRAIELAPRSPWSYRDRGSMHVQLGNFEEAIADFTRAIELQPSNADLFSSRGSTFLHIKAYERAIADCTRAIELDATYSTAYLLRGNAYLWLKKVELANADFVQLASLVPESVNAAWMAFYTTLGKERPGPEKVESLEKIAAIAPQAGIAAICKGVALGLQKNYHDGMVQLERSIQLGQSLRNAFFWKGLFCAYLGQEAEAKKAVMLALKAGLPPVLLTPLYWLEQEHPEMYQSCAVPFLVQYDV